MESIPFFLTRACPQSNHKILNGLKMAKYSQFNVKTIQWDWDEFFAASVGVGTAS